MSTTTATAIPARRIENLLRRALDPAAPAPEAETSAVMLVRFARQAEIGYAGFIAAIAPPPAPRPSAKPKRPRRPAACSVRMTRGKYSGMTLAAIAREDVQYLAWMSEEWSDADLRHAARVVLDFFAGRAEQ